jgi:peptidyl-prolyl cis-trans isomerase SDCCAG10
MFAFLHLPETVAVADQQKVQPKASEQEADDSEKAADEKEEEKGSEEEDEEEKGDDDDDSEEKEEDNVFGDAASDVVPRSPEVRIHPSATPSFLFVSSSSILLCSRVHHRRQRPRDHQAMRSFPRQDRDHR